VTYVASVNVVFVPATQAAEPPDLDQQINGALGLERGPRLLEVREGDARKSQRRATEIHLGASGGGVAGDERRLGLEEAHLPTARQTNRRGRGRVLRFGPERYAPAELRHGRVALQSGRVPPRARIPRGPIVALVECAPLRMGAERLIGPRPVGV